MQAPSLHSVLPAIQCTGMQRGPKIITKKPKLGNAMYPCTSCSSQAGHPKVLEGSAPNAP